MPSPRPGGPGASGVTACGRSGGRDHRTGCSGTPQGDPSGTRATEAVASPGAPKFLMDVCEIGGSAHHPAESDPRNNLSSSCPSSSSDRKSTRLNSSHLVISYAG